MCIRNIRIKERILREADPDLTKVMEIIRFTEIAKKKLKKCYERVTKQTHFKVLIYCKLNSKKLVTSKHEERPRTRREFKQVETQVTKPTSVPSSVKCKFCARIHEFRKEIPAWRKVCTNCNKRNHFYRCCTSNQNARAIHYHSEDEYEEIYTISVSGPRKMVKEL